VTGKRQHFVYNFHKYKRIVLMLIVWLPFYCAR